MHWSELPRSDQIFTHFEEGAAGGGTASLCRTFATSAIRRDCAARKAEVLRVELTYEGFQIVTTSWGLEPARLERALRAREYSPLLFVQERDGSHLLVDGSHTYAAAYLRGAREALAFVVAPQHWEGFLVEGLPEVTPEELLATPSGHGRV